MIPAFVRERSYWPWILAIGLGLGAASGWGMVVSKSRSATRTEAQLRGQITSLQDHQARVLSERDQARAAAADVEHLRRELSSAHDEIRRLMEAKPLQASLSAAQPAPEAIAPGSQAPQQPASATVPLRVKPPTPPRAPSRSDPRAEAKTASGLLTVGRGSGAGRRQANEQAPGGSRPAIARELDRLALHRLTSAALASSFTP